MNLVEALNLAGSALMDLALPWLLQTTAVMIAVFALDLTLRNRIRAAVRYALWLLVLIKLVLPPSLAFPAAPAYWWQPPNRANSRAALAAFPPHDIPILVNAGLLKPLGHPPVNGAKFFATEDLIALRHDPRWLARASDAIVAHWRKKNRHKRTILNGAPEEESSAARSPRTRLGIG